MKQAVVIIGLGEIGGVFARGFLRAGHPVFAITRDMDMAAEAAVIGEPALVLVAVGEADLSSVLERMPSQWRHRLGLLQNELLPRDWQDHGIADPTVVSVWFEKKKGQDVKVLLPSPIFGPGSALIQAALEHVDIPSQVLAERDDLAYELVRKNVYILTTNIAGLICGGTVETLWQQHRALAEEVASDVMDVQESLMGARLDRSRLLAGLEQGIQGDPRHQCMGRSAPARLARAVEYANAAGLAVPKLRQIDDGVER